MQSVFFKDPGRRKLQLEFDKHRNDNFKVLDDLGDTCDSLPFNFMPNYRLQIYTEDVSQTSCIPFENPPCHDGGFRQRDQHLFLRADQEKKGGLDSDFWAWGLVFPYGIPVVGLRSRNSFQNFKHYTVSTWACLAVDSLELQVMCNKVSGNREQF